MKIVNIRSKSQTKLHIKVCAICQDKFGTYRHKVKTCSKSCSSKLNGQSHIRGQYRICCVCKNSFYAKKSEDRRNCVRKYCSKKCQFHNKKMGLPTGEYLSYDGYIVIPTLPDGRKQIKKHRYVMELHIGRVLLPTEIVHHIDCNKLNNDISNLQVMTRSDHNRLHSEMERQNGKRNETQTSSSSKKQKSKLFG